MIERLKICWCVLTKKHYAVFFYNKKIEGKSGAACFLDQTSERDEWFLDVCTKYWRKVIDDVEVWDVRIKL